jgi:hypothetical protein
MRPLADPVRLMVRQDQLEETVELLKDVKLSVTGISFDKNPSEQK